VGKWKKDHKNATQEQKLEVITRAVNRIPVAFSFGPDASVTRILKTLSGITGLVLAGVEGLPEILLPNGFVYVGGARGCLKQVATQLRAYGWSLYIDNTSLVVAPHNGGNLTSTVAYLTYETGLIEVKPTTESNIPPKLDNKGRRISIPESYEFKSILNPKIAPNSLVEFNVPIAQTTILVSQAKFIGDNFGGDFGVGGKGVVWTGPGDTYRKAS